ncbi:hypothetical protein E2C01_025901 [Portunus trituberculatus]|uniref:Uncharacterized protein n=1 Tax=Portunus trituberculatus TaxID=210409 RepID=A0A5B7EJ70_PORTR|nr:hypothetical protein [Portunus trituberculatus]
MVLHGLDVRFPLILAVPYPDDGVPASGVQPLQVMRERLEDVVVSGDERKRLDVVMSGDEGEARRRCGDVS